MIYKSTYSKAFTIWELLVSMLLVSLLVTFTYTLLLQGQHLISQDQKIKDQIDRFIWLNKRLQDEVVNSDSILYSQNQIFFFVSDNSPAFVSISDSIITYSNSDRSLVTEFQISAVNLNFLDGSDVLINKININLKGINGDYLISFLKSYSKENLYKSRKE